MYRFFACVGLVGLLGCLNARQACAANPPPITFRYEHYLFSLSPSNYPGWRTTKDVWLMNGMPMDPPASFRVDGDSVPPLPSGVSITHMNVWDRLAIRSTLQEKIASKLEREPGRVTIGGTGTGDVVFDGVGFTGRSVDLDTATTLTIAAMEQGVTDVMLPVQEIQPVVTVTNPWLREHGVKEVVSIGESDFSNSPANRLHNIGVGLSKFNGHVIPQGTVFSFDKVLGPVDASTGYLKELVIKGDRTEPDYGGGLCQVSTTAYRGVWEYGFPIVQRINHSYAVSHYFPQGTDATVYPPNIDMKFKNDSPGALVIQTYKQGINAYFIYYGVRDDRTAIIIGPYLWDHRSPPPERFEYTTDLPPGQKKKLNERIPGVKAMWYRIVKSGSGEKVEPVFSQYEARPLFYRVGADPLTFGGSGQLLPTDGLIE